MCRSFGCVWSVRSVLQEAGVGAPGLCIALLFVPYKENYTAFRQEVKKIRLILSIPVNFTDCFQPFSCIRMGLML
ncbi:hypothetical protein A7X67_02005 [Clostridium sp. W14A]|nr:hypothetical protein A7X67_02005 [Clostridium sp. W14A]